jgi:hypothetical protein
MSAAISRRAAPTRSPWGTISVSTPICATLRSSISMCSGRASSTITSPPAMPTAATKVAATTRSGTTVWRVGCSSSTPSTSSREVPAPRTTAPMAHNMSARSVTSGSFAAFSITVVPLASTAAINRLSVAVWLGYSRTTLVPTRRPSST